MAHYYFQEHYLFYQETIQAWLNMGSIQLLDLAFSRDQEQRIYVQDVLRNKAEELSKWVKQGAVIYVCGSIEGMATGVDQALIEILGEESYDEHGKYNRKFVAEKVFDHQELLLKLNQIIHPAVKIHFENWVNAQNAEFVFKETALLFELKLNESCYQSILVTADENIRIKRVMDRDGRTYREVKEIIDKQMPEVDKVKLADFVIQNNTDLETLKEFTHQVIDELKRMDL